MTKGLMDRSLHHEMALERVHEKAKLGGGTVQAKELEGGDGAEAKAR